MPEEREHNYSVFRRMGNNKLANEVITPRDDIIDQLAKSILDDRNDANNFVRLHSWLSNHKVTKGLRDLRSSIVANSAINGELLSAAIMIEDGIIVSQSMPNSRRFTSKQLKEIDQANSAKQDSRKAQESQAPRSVE
jgi:hypothetical protein